LDGLTDPTDEPWKPSLARGFPFFSERKEVANGFIILNVVFFEEPDAIFDVFSFH